MHKLALAAALLIGLPAVARAQAAVDIRIDLPLILPRLVVVSPGIQVVPDVDDEVFFVDGYYWARRDRGWYRSRSHRSGWVFVPRGVPAALVKMPKGKYRRWKSAPAAYRDDHGRDHRYDDHGRDHRYDDRGHDHRDDDRGRGRDRDRHDDHGRGRGHDDRDGGHGKHKDRHGGR
jgi:hypothetical protein